MKLEIYEAIAKELKAMPGKFVPDVKETGDQLEVKFVTTGELLPEHLKKLMELGDPAIKRSGAGVRVKLLVNKETLVANEA